MGDINGDGFLELVVGSSDGTVWALFCLQISQYIYSPNIMFICRNGRDGKVLPKFPMKTGGKILAPVVMANLSRPVEQERTINLPKQLQQHKPLVEMSKGTRGYHTPLHSAHLDTNRPQVQCDCFRT